MAIAKPVCRLVDECRNCQTLHFKRTVEQRRANILAKLKTCTRFAKSLQPHHDALCALVWITLRSYFHFRNTCFPCFRAVLSVFSMVCRASLRNFAVYVYLLFTFLETIR